MPDTGTHRLTARIAHSPDPVRPDPVADADTCLAAFVRGDMCGPIPAPTMTHLADRALYHGVTALVVARAQAQAALPPEIRASMQQQALAETMWDLRHRQILAPLLTALATAGIRAALLKGTALAYSVYASPAARPRGDTDILVAERDLPATRALLARHGFVRASAHIADRMPQEEWTICLADGSNHDIDLHWNLLRPWALAALFDTDRLLADCLPVPDLADGALRLSAPMALLHACVHRASHFSGAYFIGTDPHYGGNRLIWLVDMDLLARPMTAAEWQVFTAAACQTGTAPLCLDALQDCARQLHSAIPAAVLHKLAAAPAQTHASRYLAQSGIAGRIWSDMRALPPGQSRLGFIRELFFPPEPVMRSAYPDRANQSLTRLYLHRFAERLRRLRKERRTRRTPLS
jgi:hypothetical protein